MKSLPRWFLPTFIFLSIVSAVVLVPCLVKKPLVVVAGSINISLPPGQIEYVDSAFLFIAVFDGDSPTPMPYGVWKTPWRSEIKDESSQNFAITPQDLQIIRPSSKKPKTLTLKVRLESQDKFNLNTKPLVGAKITNIKYSDRDVHLTLTKERNNENE